jgi:histidine triad (HIT) family protein
MEMPCIFCQIVVKRIPAKIVHEDEVTVAFLDLAPRSPGMTLVVPKQHITHFDDNFDLSFKTLRSALVVAKRIKEALKPKSVSLAVIESPKIPHLHVRLYPVYEGAPTPPLIEAPPTKVEEAELDRIAEKIRSVEVVIEEERVEEEEVPAEAKEPEEERPAEEAYWIRRELELA